MIIGVLPRPLRFLTRDEVMTLHEGAIQTYGGGSGLRDSNMLDAAIAVASQGVGDGYVHTVPFGMAAAYGYHLCMNHPFIDGNKRIAFLATTTFLFLNGWRLEVTADSAAEVFVKVAASEIDKSFLEHWISESVRPRTTIELRDFLAKLHYGQLASIMNSISLGPINERAASILEASNAIPMIQQANIGAMETEKSGDVQSAQILRAHSSLMTAIYRIAEEQGYEW